MAAGWIRDEPPIAARFQLPLVIAIAVAGGAVGFGITAIDGFGPAAFNETGKFHLWLFLICVQTALWALGAAVFLLLLRTPPLADVAKDARATAWLATAAVAVPVLGFVAAATVGNDLDYPLPGHKAKVTILSFIGAGVALMGVLALGRLYFALRHRRLPATKAGIEAYLDLRPGKKDSAFPKEHLLRYGAYFSLILALIYAPVYQRLVATGRRLLDDACPADERVSRDWETSYDKRKKLEELLELGVTTSGSFRAAVAITAPLVSSIVGLLLGKA
jgi:hypothetical protein